MEPRKHNFFKHLRLIGLSSLMLLGVFYMALLFSGAVLDSDSGTKGEIWPSKHEAAQIDSTDGADSLAGVKYIPTKTSKVESSQKKKSSDNQSGPTSEVADRDDDRPVPFPVELVEKLYKGFVVTVAVGTELLTLVQS